MTVSVRPDHLERYSQEMTALDSDLRGQLVALRDALATYHARNPDFGSDHTYVVDVLGGVLDGCLELDLRIGRIAAAARRADGEVYGTRHEFDRGNEVRRHLGAVDPDAHTSFHFVDIRRMLQPMPLEQWWQLVYGTGGLGPTSTARYAGQGSILGPDGRQWPLVIPELDIDGRTYHVSTSGDPSRDPATLGGRDPGWETVRQIEGTTRINDQPGGWDRWLVATGRAAGLATPVPVWASSDDLERLRFDATGLPAISSSPPSPSGARPPALPSETFGRAGEANREGRAPGAVDLVTNAAEGLRDARTLDHVSHAAFQVNYEVHEDGRRRARLLAAQLAASTRHWNIHPFTAYAGADGEFERTPLRFLLPDIPTLGPRNDSEGNTTLLQLESSRSLPPETIDD